MDQPGHPINRAGKAARRSALTAATSRHSRLRRRRLSQRPPQGRTAAPTAAGSRTSTTAWTRLWTQASLLVQGVGVLVDTALGHAHYPYGPVGWRHLRPAPLRRRSSPAAAPRTVAPVARGRPR